MCIELRRGRVLQQRSITVPPRSVAGNPPSHSTRPTCLWSASSSPRRLRAPTLLQVTQTLNPSLRILSNKQKKTIRWFVLTQVAVKEPKSWTGMPACRVTHGSTVLCPVCARLSWCWQVGPGATGSLWFVRARRGRGSTSSPSTFRAKPRWDNYTAEKWQYVIYFRRKRGI